MPSVIVITGGASGIGKTTAEILAKQFPNKTIIITSRSQHSLDEAKATIGQNAEGYQLELTDPASVAAFAQTISSKIETNTWTVAAFIHNAGMIGNFEKSKAGIEKTFHANHLGVFQLNSLIFPALLKSAKVEPCRIIVVSSELHDPVVAKTVHMPFPTFRDPEELTFQNSPDGKGYAVGVAYASSKLCNVLFTYELVKRLPRDSGITVNAFTPGWIPGTGLARNTGVIARSVDSILSPFFSRKLQRSCASLASIATDVQWKDVNGKYLEMGVDKKSSDLSYDAALQTRLWQFSENLIAKF
ncbi:hypothetical protein HK100_005692 [Physocladia obscura]|uniref:Uncharacterized protein n=1 Tax=Physocladia obscura TaxID=109957 RepID=A0AAD5T8C4_9FUNG|nr:hypothetical protein HK100_005692 [Physocladia obscura]